KNTPKISTPSWRRSRSLTQSSASTHPAHWSHSSICRIGPIDCALLANSLAHATIAFSVENISFIQIKGASVYQSIRVSPTPTPKPDIIVCQIFADKTLHHCDQDLDAQHHRILSTTIKRADVKGENGEVTLVQTADGPLLGILGLGKRNEFSADKARAAAGALSKRLKKLAASSLRLSIPQEILASIDASAAGCAIGEGLGLGNFKFSDFKRPKKDEAE